jgi:TetR/AcrR family transcriptional repressor of nem operon
MGLARSSLYQAFGSKSQLFLRCLDRYQEATALDLTSRLESASTGRAFIEGTLLWAIAEPADPKGCFVVNTANEFAQRDEMVAQLVSRGFDRYRAIFLAAVQRGQQDGSVGRDEPTEVLADYPVASMSGLRTMVKAGKDPEVLRGTIAKVMSTLRLGRCPQ